MEARATMALRKFHRTVAVKTLFLDINISSAELGDVRVTVAAQWLKLTFKIFLTAGASVQAEGNLGAVCISNFWFSVFPNFWLLLLSCLRPILFELDFCADGR